MNVFKMQHMCEFVCARASLFPYGQSCQKLLDGFHAESEGIFTLLTECMILRLTRLRTKYSEITSLILVLCCTWVLLATINIQEDVLKSCFAIPRM